VSFNFVSKNIAAPSDYSANLSGAFRGDFNGDGSDLANVSHIEQAYQGNLDDYRLVFFNNSNATYNNAERNIRGHSDLSYSPITNTFTIAAPTVELTRIPTQNIAPSTVLTIDSNNRIVKSGINIANGSAGSLQFADANGNLSSTPYIKFDGNAFYAQTGFVYNRTAFTASSTITNSEYFVGVSNSSGADIILTLPSASALTNGQTFIVKDEAGNAGQYGIIISASAGNTIDGLESVTIESPRGALNIYTDGTDKFFVY